MRTRTLAAAVLAVPLLQWTASAAPFYDAIDVTFATPAPFDTAQGRPTPPQFGLHTPGAINAAGSVVGSGYTGYGVGNGHSRPGYYHAPAGTLANLGTTTGDFGTPGTPGSIYSTAYGINDAGWVVGSSDDSAFLWADADGNGAVSGAEMQTLANNPGATAGSARAIGHGGHVLISGSGTNSAASGWLATYAVTNGVASETGTRLQLTTDPISNASINTGGAAGWTVQGQGGGFVFRDRLANGAVDAGDVFQVSRMSEFGNSRVTGLNDANQVVGTMKNANNKDVGFLWTDLDGDNAFTWDDDGNGYFDAHEASDEVLRFSGDLSLGIDTEEGNTFVWGLNNLGQVVGGYAVGTNRRLAFIWDATGGIQFLDDLVDPGFAVDLNQAYGINDAGQIAVHGTIGTSNNGRTVILTSVPEPAAAAVACLGATGLMFRRTRRTRHA